MASMKHNVSSNAEQRRRHNNKCVCLCVRVRPVSQLCVAHVRKRRFTQLAFQQLIQDVVQLWFVLRVDVLNALKYNNIQHEKRPSRATTRPIERR